MDYEPYKETAWNIRKHNINVFWRLTDYWFRILEFSFILGVLNYFNDKLDNFSFSIILKFIYWVSWTLLFLLVSELIDTVAQLLSKNKSLTNKWLIWILSFFFIYFIYVMIIEVVGNIQIQLINKI